MPRACRGRPDRSIAGGRQLLKSVTADKTLKKAVILTIALVVLVVLSTIPLPESWRVLERATLDGVGQKAIAVLIFTLILWMTEAVPFHITGILGVVIMAVVRIDSFQTIVREGFGNHIVVFFIGVLVLSAFIMRSGLGKRIAVMILSFTGNSTRTILFGFLAAGTLLSMWITDMAVAAMLMPLGRAILEEEGIEPGKSNFGRALMISCAWGPIIGGIGTPAGCGPNPIAIGFLKEMAGIELDFLGWMKYGVPAALMLLPFSWAVLLILFKPELSRLSKTPADLKNEYKKLPPLGREEKITIGIFFLTVILWLTSPLLERLLNMSIPISLPVIFTSSLFFVPGVSRIKWKAIESEVSWSGIILVLSGVSLGMMLYSSGAAKWISVVMLGGIGNLNAFLMILAVILGVSFLKIALSSNTVTATIVIPIIIELSQFMEVSTLAVTLPAALTSSLAFILVTSSPTNVIPYSTGYFSIKDFAKGGIIITLISSLLVATVVLAVGAASGLY
ncbi:MAG: DASS family sodium-coupled anion symporter [Spirochaetales bacterium]|nr:DASS family sodium-coupled anion symporter [Spirochaetales bacterium]